MCILIGFEAHEGAELTIKMYCLVIIAIQSINNISVDVIWDDIFSLNDRLI